MKEFTRFENQYILMLALRTRQELEKDLAEEIEKWGEENQSPLFNQTKRYIDTLKSIIEKANGNMKEHDRKEGKTEPVSELVPNDQKESEE